MNATPRNIKPEGDVLQIRKIGNSLGLILSKDMLARLEWKEGDKLFLVEQPERAFRLTAFDPRHASVMGVAREIIDEYKDTFRALAK